jgi:hypothetical protein
MLFTDNIGSISPDLALSEARAACAMLYSQEFKKY